MSAFAVFKDAWRNRESIGEANKSKELAAFLPAALEIQEAPPNPLLRWLSKALLLLISIAVAWAYFGHINIVASAEGKIIPSARIKQIQPLEKGLVKTLYVAEGDLVEKDQPLIALDSTLNRADTKRLASVLHSTQLRLAVNQAFLNTVSDSAPVSASSEKNQNEDKTLPTTPSKAITSSAIQAQLLNRLAQLQWELEPKKADVQLHQRLLLQKWLEYRAQLQSLHSGLQQNLAEQMATQAVIKKLKLTKPIVNQRTRVLKKLLKEKLVAETEYLQAAQERIQIQQDYAAEQQRLKQLQAVVIDLKQQINLHNAQTSSVILTEITDQQRQIVGLTEELIKTRDHSAKQIIYAPVAGRVQELAVHTIGGVVTEAQQLMLIVPTEQTLEAEVFLENKDIGFVHNDMSAEIKIHTFPFTKYGVIDATISNVSTDATLDEQQGLIYKMQLALANNTIQVNGKTVNLIPGMSVTAEVQIGERRIIEFFLAPLLKGKQEALRER